MKCKEFMCQTVILPRRLFWSLLMVNIIYSWYATAKGPTYVHDIHLYICVKYVLIWIALKEVQAYINKK